MRFEGPAILFAVGLIAAPLSFASAQTATTPTTAAPSATAVPAAAVPAANVEMPAPASPAVIKAMRGSYNVFFDADKDSLNPSTGSIVDAAAKKALAEPDAEVIVVGHTDTYNSDDMCLALSQRRADNVKAELEKRGVEADRITTVARGKTELLVPTPDKVREAQNRRATIVLR